MVRLQDQDMVAMVCGDVLDQWRFGLGMGPPQQVDARPYGLRNLRDNRVRQGFPALLGVAGR